MSKQFNINDNYHISNVVGIISVIATLSIIVMLMTKPIALQAGCFLILFSLLTCVLLFCVRYSFMLIFLLSTFTLITSWRLAALAGYQVTVWIYTLAVLLKLLNYLLFAYESIKKQKQQVTVFEWQLLFIRLFIGFDLIPHFCEKLFAGALIRQDDVHAFTQLGVHSPLLMVIIAGLMEFAGALSVACGFLTRIGSLCLAAYLLVATVLGHHFSKGFIWALPGGGWEYPVLWTVLIVSFAVFGAGDFSIDRYLKNRFCVPKLIKHLMGGRHS